MGLNYYAQVNRCFHCERSEEVHIGKSSFGWKFLFNPYKESWKEWKEFLSEIPIKDEYGVQVSFEEFVQKVEKKQKEDGEHYTFAGDADKNRVIDPEGYLISKHKEFC